jgi:hypothetical protein
MGEVVRLITGRAVSGAKLSKPIECRECGDPIETARLQLVHRKLCISCADAEERRIKRSLMAARDDEVVIIRRR